MSDKQLPVALIGAFFVIGVLLGLLFINSHSYRQLYDDAQAFFSHSSDDSPVVTQTHQAASAPVSSGAAEKSDSSGIANSETFLCDTDSAEKIRNKARSIAEIGESADGALHVRLREQWAYYTPGIRKSFLQAFAESDTCILGHSRIIHFYYDGEEIAISRPARGLVVE